MPEPPGAGKGRDKVSPEDCYARKISTQNTDGNITEHKNCTERDPAISKTGKHLKKKKSNGL